MRDHSEAVLVEYDPRVVSYEELLEVFWASHNPVAEDYSRQYRNAVFYLTDEQRTVALKSLEAQKVKARSPVTTKVEAAGEFYPAEDYHQKYYLRRRAELLSELQQKYPGESFVASTEAARIDGYLGCNGEKNEIEWRLPRLGLSLGMQERLVSYVSTNCGRLTGLSCAAPPKR
jgi:peptide-methionine (S)-S-oxide reductase